MIRLYINGTEVKDFDWSEFSINIKRDRDNRIMRITMPQKTTFRGDGYSILYNTYKSNGWCAALPVLVQKQCGGGYDNLINGTIFLNDCVFKLDRCEVDVTIRDDSYFARIYNNEDIEVCPDSNISKNGETITSCTALNLDMFRPSTGAYNSGFAHAGTRKAYDLLDVITHQLQFISDDTIGVLSDWYSNLDNDKRIAVIKGYELRNGNATDYKFFVSHRQTFKDISRVFNLWKNISDGDMRIEQVAFFYNSDEMFSLENIKSVEQSALTHEYYSAVEVGSLESGSAQNFPVMRFFGFEKEHYGVNGVCNIDRRLQLNCEEFITDTNIIEDILMNDNDGFDDKLFLIQYDVSITKATKNSITGLSGYFYNEELLNGNVINRYTFSGNTFSIVNSLSDKFKAVNTDDIFDSVGSVSLSPPSLAVSAHNPSAILADADTFIPSFRDETTPPNFDTDSRWNGSTNIYTASVSGEYSFRIVLNLTYYGVTTTPIGSPITNNRLKSTIICNASIQGDMYFEETGNGWMVTSSGTYLPEFIFSVFLGAGETFYMGAYKAYLTDANVGNVNGGLLWNVGSYAECTANPTSGGDYTFGQPNTFKSSIFNFESKLTNGQVKLLLTNPANAFVFNDDKKVWIEDISIQLKDNFATIEAVSDLNNSE